MRYPIRRAAILAACLLLASAEVRAATCTATAGGTWGPIDGGTATWNCGTPASGDDFVIPNGLSVTIDDDITQGTTAGIGITVQSGGTLTADVTAATGAIEITLGPDGLVCESGSTCNMRGRYREALVSNPGLLVDYDRDDYFILGEPALGFGGSNARVEFPTNGGYPLDSLSAISVGDVLCFFDPDLTDALVPADVNYCYEVTQVDWTPVSGNPYLEFDVRQGEASHAASIFGQRDVIRAELGSSVSAGDRLIPLTTGALTGKGRQVGRFLRFDDELEPGPHRILENGTSDVTLGDARGVTSSHSAGTTVWIDYGWQTGDPFFVAVPVKLGSATPIATDQDDSRVLMQGAVAVRAVLFDAVFSWNLDGPGVSVSQLQDVWMRDSGAGPNQAVNFLDLAVDLTVDHLTVTGIDALNPRTHSIYVRDLALTGFDLELNDVAIRHHGDDCLSSGGVPGDWVINRFRCQAATTTAQSCNLFSFTNRTGSTTVTDVECMDCVAERQPNTTDDLIVTALSGTASVSGLLSWGGQGQVGDALTNNQTYADVHVIGGGARGPGTLVPGGTTGCVAREFQTDVGSGSSFAFATNGVQDCLLRDVTVGSATFGDGFPDGEVDNIAIVNPETVDLSAGASVFRGIWNGGVSDDARIANVTVAWMPGVETTIERGFWLSGTFEVGDVFEMPGLIVSGHDLDDGAGQGTAYGILGSFNQMTSVDFQSAGPCLYDNDLDLSSGADAGKPVSTVQGQALGFVDPSTGRFDTTSGSVADLNSCGILSGVDAPGIHTYRWMHAISRVPPEMMADDADADGIVEDAQASTCSSGTSTGCSDNCPGVFNPDQADADADAIGDLCDLVCDDGVDNDGDGFIDDGVDLQCSSTSDPFEEAQAVHLFPHDADGGGVFVTISGVELFVQTAVGQGGSAIAAAVREAINASPVLAWMGIYAAANGANLETNGTIDSVVNGPPLPQAERVPALSFGFALLLVCTLLRSGMRAFS